jgi:hypothetical protein
MMMMSLESAFHLRIQIFLVFFAMHIQKYKFALFP